jgi:hypothetical protein
LRNRLASPTRLMPGRTFIFRCNHRVTILQLLKHFRLQNLLQHLPMYDGTHADCLVRHPLIRGFPLLLSCLLKSYPSFPYRRSRKIDQYQSENRWTPNQPFRLMVFYKRNDLVPCVGNNKLHQNELHGNLNSTTGKKRFHRTLHLPGMVNIFSSFFSCRNFKR